MEVVKNIAKQNDGGPIPLYQDCAEPAFFAPRALASVRDVEFGRKVIDHLAHHIVRHPGDLQQHLTRIQLAQRHTDADSLYGTLLDLFIVLQDKGRPLRERLLRNLSSCLQPQQVAYLNAMLSGQDMTARSAPPAKASMFNSGLTGTITFLTPQALMHDSQDSDPLEVVSDLIDCGRIDEAQQLLEEAVRNTPECAELSRELLALYHHSRNRPAFEKMWQGAQDLDLALRTEWQAMAESFAGELH